MPQIIRPYQQLLNKGYKFRHMESQEEFVQRHTGKSSAEIGDIEIESPAERWRRERGITRVGAGVPRSKMKERLARANEESVRLKEEFLDKRKKARTLTREDIIPGEPGTMMVERPRVADVTVTDAKYFLPFVGIMASLMLLGQMKKTRRRKR